MKFNEDLAAIHSYLCADGYVVKNPPQQKHKYYRIGLRNTNLVLLKDFQKRFKSYFSISPKIYPDERCNIGSKKIYALLTKKYSFYSREWMLPKLPKQLLKYWLRAFFDCEAWVFLKEKQNRHIGVDSVNHFGLKNIKIALESFGIICKMTKRKNRDISRLEIYGRDNIQMFQDKIGFLHPEKRKKLSDALDSYMCYDWIFPNTQTKLKSFIRNKFRVKKPFILRINSIKKNNLILLSQLLKKVFNIKSKVYGPWINGLGNSYYVLQIHKKSDVLSVLKQDLLNNAEKSKLNSNIFK